MNNTNTYSEFTDLLRVDHIYIFFEYNKTIIRYLEKLGFCCKKSGYCTESLKTFKIGKFIILIIRKIGTGR